MYGSSKVYRSRPDVLARSAHSPTQTFSEAAPGKGLNHIPSQDHTMCVCVPPSYTVSLCIGHCQHTVTQIIKPHTITKYKMCVYTSHIQSIPTQNHTMCVYTSLIYSQYQHKIIQCVCTPLSYTVNTNTKYTMCVYTSLIYSQYHHKIYNVCVHLSHIQSIPSQNIQCVCTPSSYQGFRTRGFRTRMVYLNNMTMVYLNNMTMVYLNNMTMVYLNNMTMVYLNNMTHLRNTILVRNPQRNGISQQYDTLEKYHSGTEPST